MPQTIIAILIFPKDLQITKSNLKAKETKTIIIHYSCNVSILKTSSYNMRIILGLEIVEVTVENVKEFKMVIGVRHSKLVLYFFILGKKVLYFFMHGEKIEIYFSEQLSSVLEVKLTNATCRNDKHFMCHQLLRVWV